MGLRWRLRRSFGIFTAIEVYDLQRSGVAIGSVPDQLTTRVRAGVELWARDGMVIRGSIGGERGDSSQAVTYYRGMAALDAALVW